MTERQTRWTFSFNESVEPISLGVIGCGYFTSTRFVDEVCELTKKLVPATRNLWQLTKVNIRQVAEFEPWSTQTSYICCRAVNINIV